MKTQDTDWYKTRPAAVQRRIDEYPPTHLYRLRDTGQLVRMHSYEENDANACDTCKVLILRRYNPALIVERTVFGVPFTNLEDTGQEAW